MPGWVASDIWHGAPVAVSCAWALAEICSGVRGVGVPGTTRWRRRLCSWRSDWAARSDLSPPTRPGRTCSPRGAEPGGTRDWAAAGSEAMKVAAKAMATMASVLLFSTRKLRRENRGRHPWRAVVARSRRETGAAGRAWKVRAIHALVSIGDGL